MLVHRAAGYYKVVPETTDHEDGSKTITLVIVAESRMCVHLSVFCFLSFSLFSLADLLDVLLSWFPSMKRLSLPFRSCGAALTVPRPKTPKPALEMTIMFQGRVMFPMVMVHQKEGRPRTVHRKRR
jgi:hypothetical protein